MFQVEGMTLMGIAKEFFTTVFSCIPSSEREGSDQKARN